MRRLLKDTGSIYLHCDPTASHYLKTLMDAIFGASNFRSEIVWRRSNAHNKLSRQYGPIHDILLFYGQDKRATFHPGRSPYTSASSRKVSPTLISVAATSPMCSRVRGRAQERAAISGVTMTRHHMDGTGPSRRKFSSTSTYRRAGHPFRRCLIQWTKRDLFCLRKRLGACLDTSNT